MGYEEKKKEGKGREEKIERGEREKEWQSKSSEWAADN